ncbi:hypothetical protein PTKIN_Ptkin05aG0027800 [Pterospermum kingtungense]
MPFISWQNGQAIWSLNGGNFRISGVWNVLRTKHSSVCWDKLLWASLAIPKHGFIAWMAVHDRLPTLVRLASWNIPVGTLCTLCTQCDEDRDHLFFGCDYSKQVWSRVLYWCNLNRTVMSWFDELDWAMKKLRGKALLSSLMRLAWRAYIYYIWRERNLRLYQEIAKDPMEVADLIRADVRTVFFG